MATYAAERVATRARRPAVSAGFPVVAAKITVPGVPGWAVSRPRITRLIVPGTRWCPLTVVTGPAGAGKTTALALWAAAQPGTVAWVGVDECDNRPAKLAIGVWLTVVAIRYYRKLGKPKPPKKPPGWQTHVDNMTPWYAIVLGPLTQPWALIAAGVTVIVEAKLSSWQSYLALALFCVIATSSILAMEIYAGFRPQPAQQFLARLRHWIDTHTDQVIIIVSLVLGFWLIGNSIYYIVT